MNIIITGCAGFIGFHTCKQLLKRKNIKIFGLDSLNKYYNIDLKKNRIKELKKNNNFTFYKSDLTDELFLEKLFTKNKIKYVIHLAAQAGVRYSLINPRSYLKNNLIAFFNIMNVSKLNRVKHFIFASTSSVYGNPNKFPVNENFLTDKPLSFYAATKKSNEVMAYSYSNMFKLPATSLDFLRIWPKWETGYGFI